MSLRNGTLLCALATDAFEQQVRTWCKSPKTYHQCLSNVQKAVEALRKSSKIKRDLFFGGIEDDIVRGEWSVIIGFLYELRCCYKGHHCEPEIFLSNIKRSQLKADLFPSGDSASHVEDKEAYDYDPVSPVFPQNKVDLIPVPTYVESIITEELKSDPLLDKQNLNNPLGDTLNSKDKWLDQALGLTQEPSEVGEYSSEVEAMLTESISSRLLREMDEAVKASDKASAKQRLRSESLTNNALLVDKKIVDSHLQSSQPHHTAPSFKRKYKQTDIVPGNVNKSILIKLFYNYIFVFLCYYNLDVSRIPGAPNLVKVDVIPKRSETPKKRTPNMTTPSAKQSKLELERPATENLSLGDAPDWVRELMPTEDKRPLNKSYDEIHSIASNSPSSVAILRSSSQGRANRSSGQPLSKNLRSTSVPKKSSKFPIAQLNVNYPLSSRRSSEAESLISWLLDLGVKPEPLRDLISVVRPINPNQVQHAAVDNSIERPYDANNDVVVGYVNPLPVKFPKRDVTSLLCDVVYILERKFPTGNSLGSHAQAKSIPGTVEIPTLPAQRLQNIKRCFEILQRNIKIPLSVLTCEEDILNGRIDAILNLFSSIRKAYSNLLLRR